MPRSSVTIPPERTRMIAVSTGSLRAVCMTATSILSAKLELERRTLEAHLVFAILVV